MQAINKTKIGVVIHYLVKIISGRYERERINSTRVLRLIYLADKTHLEEWGRTISSDIYTADKERGVVPKFAEEAINQSGKSGVDFQYIENQFKLLNLEPNIDELSESDIKVLNLIIELYGNLPMWHLRQLSCDRAWQIAVEKGERLVNLDDIAKQFDDSEALINYLHT